jgi:hypothetical protein
VRRVSTGAVLLLVAVLAGCGSGKSNTTPSTTSGLKSRAFITNTFTGSMDLVNAETDALTATTFLVGSSPTFMVLTPGRESTLVFDSGSNQVDVVTNSGETVAGTVGLPGAAGSIVAKDTTTAYAAIPQAVITGQTALGAVAVMNIQTFTVSSTIAVPAARRLVMNHGATKILVFSDNSDSITILDVAAGTTSTVTGFDRPVGGFFSTDDSKAFILNCGPECGGATAGVEVLNMGTTPAAGTALTLSAATMGLLNSNTLFVAGTIAGTPGQGVLNTVDVSSGAPVAGTVKDLHISDGFHTQMMLASNNKLFIGSINCTNDPNSATPTGCLTIFDTSANTAVIDTARNPTSCQTGEPCTSSKGFVTGMSPVANRNVAYVAEGGELRIFDTTTSQEIVNKVDILGQAWDVKLIDQAQ